MTNQLVAEEIETLKAIYGDEEYKCDCAPNCTGECRTIRISILHCTLIVYVNDSQYPVTAPPGFQIHGWKYSKAQLDDACQQLNASFVPGDPVVFQWAEQLREILTELSGGDDVAVGDANDDSLLAASAECALDLHEEEVVDTAPPFEITTGEKVTVKKSVFQAHVARVSRPEDVPIMVGYLLQDSKIARATHNIMAYRIANPNSTAVTGKLWLCDNDDDGETAAGSRLAHMLEMMQAEDVAVVVTRWYGGTKLGPQRFKVINNVARELIEQVVGKRA